MAAECTVPTAQGLAVERGLTQMVDVCVATFSKAAGCGGRGLRQGKFLPGGFEFRTRVHLFDEHSRRYGGEHRGGARRHAR